MKRRMCCFLIATLQIMISWYSVSSRPVASHDVASQQDHQIPHFQQAASHSKQGVKSMEEVACGDEETYSGLSRLGSRPPSCEHKCEGCFPCDAIQIPTNTGNKGLQYANYEPEGWKCKCGSTFFNP